MLRLVHSLPGLFAAVLVMVLSITGAILSIEPVIERAGSVIPESGQITVASLAAKAAEKRTELERIVRTPSGAVIVYYFDGGRPRADRIDPRTGSALAPHAPSEFTQFVTNLHRSLLLGDGGRVVSGLGAFAIIVLSVSGVMMLAKRLGGWGAILRPIRGTATQRWHSELARFAVVGLLISGLTGCYMSLATIGLIPDGSGVEVATPEKVNGGPRLAVAKLRALRSIDMNDLRELSFPYAKDLTDVYGVTTAHGIGRIDAATGAMLTFEPHSTSRQIYETIYMLHTGQGLWPLSFVLGVVALTVPILALTGVLLWWRRRKTSPRINGNVGAQSADTIILVGSEGGSTWAFAATLHAALSKAGHMVHVAPMNGLSTSYARAERMLFLTSTYGDGAAPATANRFLALLSRSRVVLPFAILGFGDRAFPKFCNYAVEVENALRIKRWPTLLPTHRIDRQSAQSLAQWSAELGAVIGTPIALDHVIARPKTIRFSLAERIDYGHEVQAPTTVFRFVVPQPVSRSGSLRRLLQRKPKPPKFAAGDLVGIIPPGSNVPRFYSLASSSVDGMLEICVRKQPGGLCSGYLHGLAPGGTMDAFIKPNPVFRPARGKAPLILIGAGAGIGPLVGIIRQNAAHRPVHLYWGGRHPASDFLYEGELSYYLSDRRLTRCRTAFSRLTRSLYVQDRIAMEAHVMRDLIKNGAQVMVCGGRDMAGSVASVIDGIIKPIGFDLAKLRAEGRYVEDVY
ncbi:MAG: PepSY domain-containing protein [Hyphomicrobiaceae bacterium]